MKVVAGLKLLIPALTVCLIAVVSEAAAEPWRFIVAGDSRCGDAGARYPTVSGVRSGIFSIFTCRT